MKILIDLSACENLKWGVSIYAIRILLGFKELNYPNITILSNEENYEKLKNDFSFFQIIKLKKCKSSFINFIRLNRFIESYYWKKTINNSDCDVFFSPSSNKFHIWKLAKKRVQTIHDLQGGKVYKGITKYIHKITTPLILHNSDQIITISNYVKNDILKEYPNIKLKNITTIYNSILLPKIDGDKRKVLDKYILFVNSLTEYKNVLTLIKAYRQLFTKKLISHKLIIIGAKTAYWNNTIVPYIIKHSLEKEIIQLENVEDTDLVNYYTNADLFITTSLYEGFGFTPIEAAICKTPVISTKEGALKETTLNLLNYYSPAKDYNNLAKKIMEVLTQNNKANLASISNELSERYNYINQSKKIYNLIYNVYKRK